ncbi:hypothetical protein FKP32DRAFT_1594095 [Trametes sanguinea]|nr:hypothetical protein FKP32DRAFT_1594095 [Trametes sanguinea]
MSRTYAVLGLSNYAWCYTGASALLWRSQLNMSSGLLCHARDHFLTERSVNRPR